jgi:hypothetical protein
VVVTAKTKGSRNYEKKNPDAFQILWYSPSNNFMKIKEAVSKKALKSTVPLES